MFYITVDPQTTKIFAIGWEESLDAARHRAQRFQRHPAGRGQHYLVIASEVSGPRVFWSSVMDDLAQVISECATPSRLPTVDEILTVQEKDVNRIDRLFMMTVALCAVHSSLQRNLVTADAAWQLARHAARAGGVDLHTAVQLVAAAWDHDHQSEAERRFAIAQVVGLGEKKPSHLTIYAPGVGGAGLVALLLTGPQSPVLRIIGELSEHAGEYNQVFRLGDSPNLFYKNGKASMLPDHTEFTKRRDDILCYQRVFTDAGPMIVSWYEDGDSDGC